MILMILEGFHQQEVFCEYIVNDVFERTFLLWFNWTFRKRPDLFASLPEVGVWRWGRNGSLCTHIMVSLVGSIPVTRLLETFFLPNSLFTLYIWCAQNGLSAQAVERKQCSIQCQFHPFWAWTLLVLWRRSFFASVACLLFDTCNTRRCLIHFNPQYENWIVVELCTHTFV